MPKLSDFDYDLPDDLIAQYPVAQRGESRLMVIDRATDGISTRKFSDFASYPDPGDALVLNDTKVFPCRIRAEKEDTGAQIELLLLRELEKGLWESLVRPGKRAKVGTVLSILGARRTDTVASVPSWPPAT